MTPNINNGDLEGSETFLTIPAIDINESTFVSSAVPSPSHDEEVVSDNANVIRRGSLGTKRPTPSPNGSSEPARQSAPSTNNVNPTKEQPPQTVPSPNSITNNYSSSNYSDSDNSVPPAALVDTTKYQPLDAWETPVDMLVAIDPMFSTIDESTGRPIRELYPWQIETLVFLAMGGTFNHKTPLKFNLCAANGSGKDAFVIAPLAVWLIITQIRHRVIVTSASFDQLSGQTETEIRRVVDLVNNWATLHAGGPILSYKQFQVVCNTTRSEIKMFAKDDPGRVEGYHPFSDYPGAGMCVIVNEAKSVAEGIQDAMKRFTGFSRWINISSPAKTSGPFYRSCMASKEWDGVTGYDPDKAYFRRVTAWECPHIGRKTIEEAKIELGETSSLFRSIYLAEFTSIDEAVMISKDAIDRCIADPPPHVLADIVTCGIDLALGGDETSLRLVLGNKVGDKYDFRDKDAVSSARKIVDKLDTWRNIYGLSPDNTYGDGGGLGKAVLDIIRDKGWDINRVYNQSPARQKNNFGNIGAEMWFRFKRLVEQRLFILDKDDAQLLAQLSSRYHRESDTNNKVYLESKQEARAKGHGSPDRADALVLAVSPRLDIQEFVDAATIARASTPARRLHMLGGPIHANQGRGMSIDELEEFRFNRAMRLNNPDNVEKRMNSNRSYGSLSALLSKMQGNNKSGQSNRRV